MGRRRKGLKIDGVLLLDKPVGLSSNTALQKARRLLNAQKAGHTGTLDPLASGLLPLCFGEATKFSADLLNADKEYVTTVRFGIKTTTGDAEGDIVLERDVHFDRPTLEAVLDQFRGEIEQIPPMYSALKRDGKPLYELARRGEEVKREPRKVVISHIDILDFNPPEVTLSVRCSKGTYIRVLGEDIGERLGCGGHLTSLRRTATGALRIEQSVSLEAFEAMDENARLQALSAPDCLLSTLPAVELDEVQTERFRHGGSVACEPTGSQEKVRVYGSMNGKKGILLGMAEREIDGLLVPRRLCAFEDAGGDACALP